jgi:predicted transcriptional regulator
MTVSEHEVLDAEKRMAAKRAKHFAVSALYDRSADRIVVTLNSGVDIAFPPRLAEGLAGASADELTDIEISPAGLGLHWPKLDADLFVPALLEGAFGSKRWMAALLGAAGGRAQSHTKAAAARANGRKGGRPRKAALKPAIPPEKSVTPDYIICLEDGQKLKSLTRHLRSQHNLSPEEYRERWGLPSDYPMVAPRYAKARAALAQQMGLGQRNKRRA